MDDVELKHYRYAVWMLALFSVGFNLSTATITWIYMADILNDTGVTLVSAFIWAIYGSQLKGVRWISVDVWNYSTLFMLLIISTIAGLVFIIVFVKETKCKS